MKFTKLMFVSATLALAVASAASSYDVTLSSPTMVGSTELKAGDYKIQVEGSKVTFKSGKNVIEVQATVSESGDKKYPITSFESSGAKLKEIHLGGTKTKLVFESAVLPAGGE